MEGIIIKNHQYIRNLSVKELTKLLVKEVEVNEGDEGMDGEWLDCYITYFISPNGVQCYDFESAIAATMDWLNAERK